jgi:hypothetical protein
MVYNSKDDARNFN